MSREKSLWSWLDVEDPLLDMTRVENSVDEGTPDVEGSYRGIQFWCELKSCKRPVRPTTPCRPKVRDAQEEWISRRWARGGLVWLLVQVGERHKAVRYLISGKYAWDVQFGATEENLRSMSSLYAGRPLDYVRRMATLRN